MKVSEGRTTVEVTDQQRDRFTPAEVVKLFKAAEAKGDLALAAAIPAAAAPAVARKAASPVSVLVSPAFFGSCGASKQVLRGRRFQKGALGLTPPVLAHRI